MALYSERKHKEAQSWPKGSDFMQKGRQAKGRDLKKKNSLNTGIARKGGGGSTLAQKFLEHSFLSALYLGKMPKGGGVRALPKDLEQF